MAEEKIMVLFVDDDPLVLKAILRRYNGHPTISALAALSPEAALKLMEATRVDVVVSDLRMPSVHSTKFLQNMREQHPGTAYILLSGFLDAFWLKRACQLTQVEALLPRPFDNEGMDGELIEVDQRRTGQQLREAVSLARN